MAALERWNDGRLDDLSRRVDVLAPLEGQVIRLTANLSAHSDDLRDIGRAISGLRDDLKEMKGDPVKDARERRNALLTALVSAVIVGIVTLVATLIGTGGL